MPPRRKSIKKESNKQLLIDRYLPTGREDSKESGDLLETKPDSMRKTIGQGHDCGTTLALEARCNVKTSEEFALMTQSVTEHMATGQNGAHKCRRTANPSSFDIDQVIANAANTDKKTFLDLWNAFYEKDVKLDFLHVIYMLHGAGILSVCPPRHLVLLLASRLEGFLVEPMDITELDVGNALYGLRGFRDSEETRRLVRALTPIVPKCRQKLTASSIGRALTGLQGPGGSDEVFKLIASLTLQVELCTEAMDAHTVCNVLYGLHRFGDSEETCKLAKVMIPHVQRCPDELVPRQIADALYGLHGLGDLDEVRQIVLALSHHVRRCSKTFGAQDVSYALCGLQRLNDSPGVCELLRALTPCVQKCSEEMGPAAICNALYGLKGFGDSLELLQLMAALTPHVRRCSGALNERQICKSLYVFDSKCDSPEMRQLASALLPHVQRCRGKLNDEEIYGACVRLLKCRESKEVCQLIEALLAPKVAALRQNLSKQREERDKEVEALRARLTALMKEMREREVSIEKAEVRAREIAMILDVDFCRGRKRRQLEDEYCLQRKLIRSATCPSSSSSEYDLESWRSCGLKPSRSDPPEVASLRATIARSKKEITDLAVKLASDLAVKLASRRIASLGDENKDCTNSSGRVLRTRVKAVLADDDDESTTGLSDLVMGLTLALDAHDQQSPRRASPSVRE